MLTSQAPPRVAFSIRVTPEEQQIIAEAAKREHRSINSFVLEAALRAATRQQALPRTPESVQAAITRAQELMRPFVQQGRSLADELSAERRAEAARE